MRRLVFPQRYFSVPDLIVLLVFATLIYGLMMSGQEWRSDYHPVTQIDLSPWALPRYTLLSAMRGVVAYLISLAFTLVVGYVAAKSRAAERVIIPMLDIFQSVPVLGFLPGLLVTLVSLFPHTNLGLELTTIFMIFTGQVWNMTFSFYSSLKSIPEDLKEAATVIGLSRGQRFLRVELPFSAVNLVWNSLLSMAGGWFFLILCEAFTLGDREYRLPGIGAYMHVAIQRSDTSAMLMGIFAMVSLIVIMDFVIWRPILSWVQRFRLEGVGVDDAAEPLMNVVIRESRIVLWLKQAYRERLQTRLAALDQVVGRPLRPLRAPNTSDEAGARAPLPPVVAVPTASRRARFPWIRIAEILFLSMFLGVVLWSSLRLFRTLAGVPLKTWSILLRNTLWTFLRVMAALAISTAWAVPLGIWIGTSSRRVRIAQPLIQVIASFPAPMLYPLALALFFKVGVHFDWGSMLLMLLAVQWYVLFNVLAGALRIPRELDYALELMATPRWERWKRLYLPSVFPSLVTGWVIAAGGAWNSSIVAEYAPYEGRVLSTNGLGATISVAAANGNFEIFAASLVVMVGVVVFFNRTVWARAYSLAQRRYRMDA
jgi:NitT/TauT family transport system permease protein